MKRFLLLALLLLPAAARADEIRHSFFIAGPSFTGIIDEDGKETWDAGKPAAKPSDGMPAAGKPAAKLQPYFLDLEMNFA